MSVLSGFFDSSEHDRLYNAEEFSSLFDGLINDGVYAMYKDAMIVRPSAGMNITVGTGRAWFNHTWTYVDSPYVITIDTPQAVIGRIDAVVLRIDKRVDYRANSIEVIKGTPSSTPVKPTVDVNPEEDVYQYPLAYVTVDPEAIAIGAEDIENVIGTSRCPFVTAVIEYVTTDQLIAQWQAQWDEWLARWYSENTEDFISWSTQKKSEYEQWLSDNKAAFEMWFENLSYVLDGDVVGHLQNEIDRVFIDQDNYISIDYDLINHKPAT